MPPVVVTAPENEVLLRPDNLRANLEADAVEAGGNFAGVNTGMPHVGDIAGKQHERRRPVYLIVVGDPAQRVPAAAVHLDSPTRVVRYAVGWVRGH